MNTLISINRIYYLIGIIVMMLVVMTLRDKGNPKRLSTALFWFLFGAVFLFGDLLVENLGKSMAHRIIGATVIIISLIAGTGMLSMGSYATSTHEERVASSKRLGNWLFFPAVLIPVITVACTVLLKGVSVGGVMLLDQKQLTLAALCVACLRPHRRLRADPWHAAAGGAPVAPPGGLDRLGRDPAADAGHARRRLRGRQDRYLGAAGGEPVRQSGQSLPGGGDLLRGHGAVHDGDGQCRLPGDERGHRPALPDPGPSRRPGTAGGHRHVLRLLRHLMTPMAANYNIVPAALLELKNKYQVIKVQIPTALTLLTVNVFLMYFLAFR
jgi:hypothetical protein